MVLINDGEFQVYDLDTIDTVVVRLASSMKTLPTYLYFDSVQSPTLANFKDTDNLVVADILQEIKEAATTGIPFSELYDVIEPMVTRKNLSWGANILPVYVAFNSGLKETDEIFRQHIIFAMQSELETYPFFNRDVSVEGMWKNRKVTSMELGDAIASNARLSNKSMKMFKMFDGVVDGVPYTRFEMQKVKFSFSLGIENMSLLELFNRMRLNPLVPLASIGEFFKILKDFTPPVEWSDSYPDAIVVRVLEKNETVRVKTKDYSDAWVAIADDKVNISMYLDTIGGNITQQAFITRFLDVFSGFDDGLPITNLVDDEVNGVFYLPQQSLNKYVFSDMAMNNPLFSNLMYVDESEKASKKKSSVYIHFLHPTTGDIGANITQKTVIRGDPNLKGKSIDLFPVGSDYIRIKVSKADSSAKVKAFQSLFSRLIVIYDREKDNIIQIYRTYIPEFAKEKAEPPPKKVKAKLKEIAPEIFVAGHSRKCKTPPNIVSDEEAAVAAAEGKNVMIFPKLEDEASISRNYVCDYPKHIYPGLKENKLANAEQFPYMPCCYTSDQSINPGSKYRNYYMGEDLLEGKDIGQKELYTTNKFAPPDKFGTLPATISKLFALAESDDTYTYVRKGTFRNKSSFLNCVLEGLNAETNIVDIAEEGERNDYISQLRTELSEDRAMLGAARQEMFDYTQSDISGILANPDIYLNPRLFVGMLEAKFNCNIFLFSRERILTPRHAQTYYKTQRKSRCIFVLEHMGSESDNAAYPQCELITRWNQTDRDETFYDLPYSSHVSATMEKLSRDLRASYSLDLINLDSNFLRKYVMNISVSQNTDSYGKCRMIQLNKDGLLSTLMLNPMQPLSLPENHDWSIHRVTVDQALDIAASLRMIVSGQIHIKGFTKEIIGTLGGVGASIPVLDSSKIPKIPVQSARTPFPEGEEVSKLANFNANKKFARYVVEYMLWLYSTYIVETGITELDNDSIEDFMEAYVEVDPDFVYGYVTKYFSKDSGVMENDKLMLLSEETQKRLVYVLKLAILRNQSKIIGYHEHTMIDNFYMDVADFDHFPLQVILQGDKSISKWIDEKQMQNVISDSILPDMDSPYFFWNDLIARQMYIAHNVSNLAEAISVSLTWFRDGYNDPDPSPYEDEMPEMTLYSYTSATTMVRHEFPGVPVAQEIIVVGYKRNGIPFYTSLLPL
jgi:hypothetical protein